MDNEKYTCSLIDSIENYVYNLQYLSKTKRTTLRALNTYKIFHWLYSWADWFDTSELDKMKIEKLMNCLILRNSLIVFPTIVPQTFYTNVSSPQNMWTWRIFNTNTTVVTITVVELTVTSINGDSTVPISFENSIETITDTTPTVRTYYTGETITCTAPATSNGNALSYWILDGTPQSPGVEIEVLMDTNHTIIASYATPSITRILTATATNGGNGVEISFDNTNTDSTTVGTTPTTKTYDIGDRIICTAPLMLPISSNLFTNWTLDGVLISGNELEVIMDKNHTIVAVYKEPVPPVGSIKINKQVLDPNDDPDTGDLTEFTITLSKNGTILDTRNFYQGIPIIFASLELGTYEITEVINSDYSIESTNPYSVTLTIAEINKEITIINKQLGVTYGSITIKKVITGSSLSETLFTYYVYSNSTGMQVQGSTTEDAILTSLPFGTYTIEESPLSNYTLTSISPTNGVITLTALDPDQIVTVTNAYNV